jgi:hypothetical protein
LDSIALSLSPGGPHTADYVDFKEWPRREQEWELIPSHDLEYPRVDMRANKKTTSKKKGKKKTVVVKRDKQETAGTIADGAIEVHEMAEEESTEEAAEEAVKEMGISEGLGSMSGPSLEVGAELSKR